MLSYVSKQYFFCTACLVWCYVAVWCCFGGVSWFFCYYLGSALHTGVRAVVAFLVHRMGRDKTHAIILPHPPHHLPVCPPQLASPDLHPAHLHPVPTISHLPHAWSLVPGPYMGLCGFQLLPDVSLSLGAGKQFLPLVCTPLMCVHLFPELRGLWGVMWGVGQRQRPECPVQLRNVTCSILPWRALLELAGPSTQDSISVSAASA